MSRLPKNDDGSLMSFAWPGGYPILYLDADNCVLCPECANLSVGDGRFSPVDHFVYWEGPPEICENCNEQFPSAYGDTECEEYNTAHSPGRLSRKAEYEEK